MESDEDERQVDDRQQEEDAQDQGQGGEDGDGEEDGEEDGQGDGDGDYVPSTEEQPQGDSSAAPRRPHKFRRSHCVPPPPAPMTEVGKRVISPVGDRYVLYLLIIMSCRIQIYACLMFDRHLQGVV
jgi:hypothetical protein